MCFTPHGKGYETLLLGFGEACVWGLWVVLSFFPREIVGKGIIFSCSFPVNTLGLEK